MSSSLQSVLDSPSKLRVVKLPCPLARMVSSGNECRICLQRSWGWEGSQRLNRAIKCPFQIPQQFLIVVHGLASLLVLPSLLPLCSSEGREVPLFKDLSSTNKNSQMDFKLPWSNFQPMLPLSVCLLIQFVCLFIYSFHALFYLLSIFLNYLNILISLKLAGDLTKN